MEAQKVYVLVLHDYSGDGGVEVYKNAEQMMKDIEEDVRNACENLEGRGYNWTRINKVDAIEVYASVTDIYYEWSWYECDLR